MQEEFAITFRSGEAAFDRFDPAETETLELCGYFGYCFCLKRRIAHDPPLAYLPSPDFKLGLDEN